MTNRAQRGSRGRRFRRAKLAAAVWSSALTCACFGQVTLTKTSNTNWTLTDDGITAVFDPAGEEFTSIKLGSSPSLLDGGGLDGSLNPEFAGTPFGTGTQTFGDQIGPDNSYVDVWTSVASTGTTVNPITYAFHYVMFTGDPTIYCYEVLNHSATDPATQVAQSEFLFRSNPALFNNLYQNDTGPNNLSPQITTNIASASPLFPSASGTAGRVVQNVTYDLTGSGISSTSNLWGAGAGDDGTNYFTKYDYKFFSQFFQADTMYGSQYAVTMFLPNTETEAGGPTKQMAAWTDPAILNMEFISDHYGIDGTGSGAFPGYAWTPPQGVASTRLFGPAGFRITADTTGSAGAAQVNSAAIASIPNALSEFYSDSELIASGYTPAASRATVQINASSSAGWSADTTNNTVVLSDPYTNFQETTNGDQYWAQLSAAGTATIDNVADGTYRMTLYQLGQWGETRYDGVQVQGSQVVTPQNLKFVPENFGSAPPIWTIGTPNRSDNEFTDGHDSSVQPGSSGPDLRQYYGAYDFWAEEAALGTPGYVSYDATNTTINGVFHAATNDPNDWIGTQWYTFNPGEYDPSNGTDDNYANVAPAYVTAGGGPANYHGDPWQIHFTVTPAQLAQGQYVELSIAVCALDADLFVSLNGHSEEWKYNNFSPDDPMIRSGDSGFYQWGVFEFPVSDLNAPGIDDEFALSVSSHLKGVMYDALRMEISNTSSNPSVTGWYDYNYISPTTFIQQDDALDTVVPIPEPSHAIALFVLAAVPLLRRRRRAIN